MPRITGKTSKKAFIGLTALGISVLAMACNSVGPATTEVREDSFSVGSDVKLDIDGFNGSVTVNGGQDGQVDVRTTLRRPERIDYSVEQDGDTIIVRAKKKSGFGGIFAINNEQAKIEVSAPSNSVINLETSNGAIELTGITGGGTLNTSNGAITAIDVSGDYDLDTSNGKVTVRDARGSFKAETSNGSIDFDGELIAGSNRMTTSNGSITVKLHGDPNVTFDASTSNGSINSSVPMVTTASGRNHLAGTIGSGEAELDLRTSNGSIRIIN